MTLHNRLVGVIVAFLASLLLFYPESWQVTVSLLWAMATFATCAIMMKDRKEPKEVTELKNKLEATSQDVKRLHLKLGFK